MDLTLERMLKRTRDEERERCLRLIEARIRRLEKSLAHWQHVKQSEAVFVQCQRLKSSLYDLRTVRDWIAVGITEHDTADRSPDGIPQDEG